MGLESESTAEKTGFSKVKLWFTRNAKLLVVCFAVGMICHAQMYLNGLSNPDAVVSLSNPNGYGSFIPHAWDISLGRWGLLFAACAKFGLCSPILTSAITIALFTLGIVALIDGLGIKRACLQYASSILFIASPFVSCCITYYYCSNSYALSFFVCGAGRMPDRARWGCWQAGYPCWGGCVVGVFARLLSSEPGRVLRCGAVGNDSLAYGRRL